MKRRALPIKLLLFVFAGAIINVAVAWIFALGTARTMSSVLVTPPDPAVQWIVPVPGDWPEPVESGIERGLLWTMHMRSAVREHQFVYQFGVTLRALQYELTTSGRPNTFWTGTIGRPDYLGVEHAHHLPCRPLVPGFAINTIFYAAILYALFASGGVPRAVRRRLRHKRGQCASCGYLLRENVNEKCPECGAVMRATVAGDPCESHD